MWAVRESNNKPGATAINTAGETKMNRTQTERYGRLVIELTKHGLDLRDIDTLLRCSRTLTNWNTEECNGTIQRTEIDGQCYRHYGNGTRGPFLTVKIADREAGAVRRIEKICKAHGLSYYHQGDPRGCALYIIRPGDVADGQSVECCYNRGVAICID